MDRLDYGGALVSQHHHKHFPELMYLWDEHPQHQKFRSWNKAGLPSIECDYHTYYRILQGVSSWYCVLTFRNQWWRYVWITSRSVESWRALRRSFRKQRIPSPQVIKANGTDRIISIWGYPNNNQNTKMMMLKYQNTKYQNYDAKSLYIDAKYQNTKLWLVISPWIMVGSIPIIPYYCWLFSQVLLVKSVSWLFTPPS